MSTQIQNIKELTPEIPTNEYGLVTGFYRPDFLPDRELPDDECPEELPDVELPDEEDIEDIEGVVIPFPSKELARRDSKVKRFSTEELEVAWTPLMYDGGYPVLPDGSPFWNQLDYESPEAFQTFTAFLQLPTLTGTGTRVLSELSAILTKTAGKSITPEMLQGLYHLYYWNQRVSAYDLFKVAAHRKELELRAITTQDDHYSISMELLTKLHEYMESEEDFWDLMTPKVAIDFQKNLMQMQRISAGLPGATPLREEDREGTGLSVEVLMRQQGGRNSIAKVGTDEDQSIILERALEDEDTAEVAQELVIRLNRNK